MSPTRAAIEAQLAAFRRSAAVAAEARARSKASNLRLTASAFFLAIGPALADAQYVFGRATLEQTMCTALSAWAVFEIATLAFHLCGPSSAWYRTLLPLDECAQQAAPMLLIYFSGSSGTPLWLLGMVRVFVGTERSAAHVKRTNLFFVGAHLSLIAAFALTHRMADAYIILLVLLTSLSGRQLTDAQTERRVRVRAERTDYAKQLHDASLEQSRDRIARELHDGTGSDIMGLVLKLRRVARESKSSHAAELADKAQNILDGLRGVVWSLRHEQGTLAELAKLIDVSSKSARGGLPYQRKLSDADAQLRVASACALTALTVSRELLCLAAACDGARALHLQLSCTPEQILALRVRAEGAQLSSVHLEQLLRQLAWSGDKCEFHCAEQGIVVQIPLGAASSAAVQPDNTQTVWSPS